MAALSKQASAAVAFLLSDLNLRMCAIFCAVAIVMPPDGLGLDLCVLKRLTGAPCPGCGMTRCGSNLVRGNFARAFEYSPPGIVVFPLIAALGFVGLAPSSWRNALRRRLHPIPIWLNLTYILGCAAFLAFGIVRWTLVIAGWNCFPSH